MGRQGRPARRRSCAGPCRHGACGSPSSAGRSPCRPWRSAGSSIPPPRRPSRRSRACRARRAACRSAARSCAAACRDRATGSASAPAPRRRPAPAGSPSPRGSSRRSRRPPDAWRARSGRRRSWVGPFDEIAAAIALQVEQGGEIAMVDARGALRPPPRAWRGRRRPGPPPSASAGRWRRRPRSRRRPAMSPCSAARRCRVASLASLPRIGRSTVPASVRPSCCRPLAAWESKASALCTRAVKWVKPPDTSAQWPPCFFMVATRVAPPGM